MSAATDPYRRSRAVRLEISIIRDAAPHDEWHLITYDATSGLYRSRALAENAIRRLVRDAFDHLQKWEQTL